MQDAELALQLDPLYHEVWNSRIMGCLLRRRLPLTELKDGDSRLICPRDLPHTGTFYLVKPYLLISAMKPLCHHDWGNIRVISKVILFFYVVFFVLRVIVKS